MSGKRSTKIQKLVVNAIRKLQDVQGSTSNEISNYISQEYDVPSTKIKRQVNLALARALSYGILQRSKGGYVCNRELLVRQPQLFDEELVDKCIPHGRRRAAKRGRSGRKRRRGGASSGSKKRSRKRRGGGRSRKRRGGGSNGSGRKMGRRGGRRRGGKKSRRGGKKSRRGRRGRRGGKSRRGKSCGTGRGDSGDENGIFGGRIKRRRARRSVSGIRNENRAASVSPSVSDEERLDDKRCDEQPIESPEIALD